MGIRKNQKNLTKTEWKALISAIDAMHGTEASAPAYRRFVTLHVDAMSMAHMDWSVHTMRMDGALMRGKNFLTWHRRFLKLFEERIQTVDPTITIPYWDSITDRSIPTALDDPGLLTRWSVRRDWDGRHIGVRSQHYTFQSSFAKLRSIITASKGNQHGQTITN
jgi:tyrosinase